MKFVDTRLGNVDHLQGKQTRKPKQEGKVKEEEQSNEDSIINEEEVEDNHQGHRKTPK